MSSSASASQPVEQPPLNHKDFRRQWMLSGLAAAVAIAVSFAGLAASVLVARSDNRSANQLDARDFVHTQEIAAIAKWDSSESKMTFDEQGAEGTANARIKSQKVVLRWIKTLHDDYNSLGVAGEGVDLVSSANTFRVLRKLAFIHAARAEQLESLVVCAHEHNPDIGTVCDRGRPQNDDALTKAEIALSNAVKHDLGTRS
jgi:hypothetical protein